MMQDWNAYRSELTGALGELAQVSPDLFKAFDRLAVSKPKQPQLDAKTRELIAIAVSVTTRCDGCIAFHTQAARKAGASKEEIVEALCVAVAFNAGAAMNYSARALESFNSE